MRFQSSTRGFNYTGLIAHIRLDLETNASLMAAPIEGLRIKIMVFQSLIRATSNRDCIVLYK